MPEVEDHQEVQEQGDQEEDENEERCDEYIHDRDAVTPMQLKRTERRIRTKKIEHSIPYPLQMTTRFQMLMSTRKPRKTIHQKKNPLTHLLRKPKGGPRFVSNF